MIKKRYMLAAFIMAMALWITAQQNEAVQATPIIPPTLHLEPATEDLIVEPVLCLQPWLCTFNVVKYRGILSRSVLVRIEGYTAPSLPGWCSLERRRSRKAITYLQELMKGAEILVLRGAHKDGTAPAIHGRLFLDGEDVAHKLIAFGVVAPPRLAVNWCEKPPEELEV